MKIKKISIKNFRAIEKIEDIVLKDLTMMIGDNGTSKTSILEAINFCLSPYFLSGKIKHTDFYNGADEPIEIFLEFDEDFKVLLPDGYTDQEVECNKIYLKIKKRERAANQKAFSDIVVVSHYAIPSRPKDNDQGWEIIRGTGSIYKFDSRQLSFPLKSEGIPKSFYFAKNREKQLQRGYNSSITSVFDDFNWRFAKEIKKQQTDSDQLNEDGYLTKKQNLESEILNQIDDKSLQKSFDALNKKLKSLDIEQINLSIFDGNAPFNSAFLCQKIENLDLSVSQLGSGVEMIISLLFLETLASLSKDNFIVLIDEPELHLHPRLQNTFVNYLIELSKNSQVILSTHSPYFFKNCLSNNSIELLITKKENNKIIVDYTSADNFGLFSWSPSWGEVNYLAYNLPTIEFHDELYGSLHEKYIGGATNEEIAKTRSTQKNFDYEYLQKKFESPVIKKWTSEYAGSAKNEEKFTLQTFIRNKTHHPENKTMQSSSFTQEELKQSIDMMVYLKNTQND